MLAQHRKMLEMTDSLSNPSRYKASEADVREEIVRPLLHSLGYKRGTENEIRTEVTLRYPKVFLGHKKPHDRDLTGRPDYICYAGLSRKWTVEVKAPNQNLSEEDREQAHSYAVHPEICACFYLLTNGREFRLYTPDQIEPVFSWLEADASSIFLNIKNWLSPEAIEKRFSARVDPGKHLANLFGSEIEIVGGTVLYEGGPADVRLSVLRGKFFRQSHGQIAGEVFTAGPFVEWDKFNKRGGFENFTLLSTDEYISTEAERPSIFQGFLRGVIKAGEKLPVFPGAPVAQPEQFVLRQMTIASRVELIGYIRERQFVGTFEIVHQISYDTTGLDAAAVERLPQMIRAGGTFEIQIRDP